MRLLYGVQATGNGHISRARALRHHLAAAGCQIDFVFSGRAADKFFDMAEFGNYELRKGLSFVTEAGRIKLWPTAQQADLARLWQDISSLNTRRYDLVLTDYEPVTAWAARRQGTPVLALGHQYALQAPVPLGGFGWWHRRLLYNFAPARQSIGLHWHHFDSKPSDRHVVLPPVVHLPQGQIATKPEPFVLVYLPFEAAAEIVDWLQPLGNWRFRVYGATKPLCRQARHIEFMPASVAGFQQDLIACQAVISNAGFELISEALQLNKRILVKPLSGQPEQQANAAALQQLRLADCCQQLSSERLLAFLQDYQRERQVQYPDVAAAISQWLLKGQWFDVSPLANLWQQCNFSLSAPQLPAAQLSHQPALARSEV